MNKEKATDAFNLNMSTVLEFIYRNPYTSRIEIANSTGITPATITNIISDLLNSNSLIETGDETQGIAGSGRKRKMLTLNSKAGILLGLEFNMKGFFLSATDLWGNVIAEAKEVVSDVQLDKINEVIVTIIKQFCKRLSSDPILGLGIAIPGHFSEERNGIISNNPMWEKFNLLKINNEFSFPIIIENNIECMAIGEYLFNSATTPEKFLFLHSGHGLFCSFFNSDQVGSKDNYYLGEIGHTVVDIHGPQCECGKKGCLQTFISESWLLKNAKYLFEHSNNTVLHSLVEISNQITLETIIDAYKLHDTYIKERIELGIKLLGTSIANTLIMQDAEKIYLNSELFIVPDFRKLILEIISEQLQFIPTKRKVDIEIVDFNRNRGSLGACALACMAFFIKHPSYL